MGENITRNGEFYSLYKRILLRIGECQLCGERYSLDIS